MGQTSRRKFWIRVIKRRAPSCPILVPPLRTSKTTAVVPQDFKIKTAQEIKDEQAAAQAEKDKQNPQLALWKQLKGTLASAEGASYFSSSMKDALIPTLKGKVVSIQPAVKPKTIVMSLEDGTTADVTLKF